MILTDGSFFNEKPNICGVTDIDSPGDRDSTGVVDSPSLEGEGKVFDIW
jgi:hypothetical protein